MARRSNNTDVGSTGCAIILLCCLVVPFLVILIGIIISFLGSVYAGAKAGIISLIVMLVAYIAFRIVFYYTHQKSLNYDQITILSRRRARKYAKDKYVFRKAQIVPNAVFKSSLDVAGRWYSINEPLSTFPSLVAALLKGKHHEWVIIAIEKDGIVTKMWANKGFDNQSVSFNCDINEIIRMCKQNNSYSVLRFHNHPNSDPRHYTTLLASEQDRISAKSCSDIVCNAGFNWFDFVCAQGDYIMFFSRISEGFQIQGSTVSDIVDHSGITPAMDYSLQKEYHHLDVHNNKLMHVIGILICVSLALLIAFRAGHTSTEKPVESSIETTSTSAEVIETVITDAPELVSIWASEPTSIDNFEYYIRDNTIFLTDYIGDEEKVWINSEYIIDGETYTVGDSLGSLFSLGSVYSVILPEGVTQVSGSIFNSCGVKYIYIPQSLISDDGSGWYPWYGYLFDVDRVFYGGSEEQWQEITNYTERSDIDVMQIIYNVSMDDLMSTYDYAPVIADPQSNGDTDNGVWASGPTSLSSFEFYIDGDTIFLTKYIGESEKVWIGREYIIDGQTYTVCSSLESLVGLSSASSLIISEGFTYIRDLFLWDSDLMYVYIPQSLDPELCGDFYNNFVEIKEVHFGGTEEEWATLTDGADRFSINAETIVYDASVDAL